MDFKKSVSSLLVSTMLVASSISPAFADSITGGDVPRIVTIGVNNTSEQRKRILNYFGVKEDEVKIIEVNNQEEREYLEGIATEEQIGTKTYSCAYLEPSNSNTGIQVKTANISWVTSSMIASTISTATASSNDKKGNDTIHNTGNNIDLSNINVVIASDLVVSGTGAMTGVLKAIEVYTGQMLDETKKELASEELIITGDLGDDIGTDKATGIVNDVKLEIIKNGTSDTTQIAETINNITNNYNITLSQEQTDQLMGLMNKISKQDYDYNSMKNTLNNVSDIVLENLKEAGEKVNTSNSIGDFFSGIGKWFSDIFNSSSKDLGILGETNDNMLGDNAIITATNKDAENLISKEEVEGFFQKIGNWFKGLFNNLKENTQTEEVETFSNTQEDTDLNEYNSEVDSTDTEVDFTDDNEIENSELEVEIQEEQSFSSEDL